MANCIVAAQPEFLRDLQAALGPDHLRTFDLRPLPPDVEVPDEFARRANCLILEVDPESAIALSRIERLRKRFPELALIAAVEKASLDLMRSLVRLGVRDVVELPFDREELVSRVLDLTAGMADRRTDGRLAPVVGVVRSAGGVGATSVATHLASAMARTELGHHDCCIIDLDLQFGQVAAFLGVEPSASIPDFLEMRDRLDGDVLRNSAGRNEAGVYVLGQPKAITPLEDVDVDRLLRLIELAREEFSFVVLDLPSNWTSWSLSAAVACTYLLLVTDQTIPSLRAARRTLDLFESVEVPPKSIGVVVNRAEKRFMQSIRVSDVEETLRYPAWAALPAVGHQLGAAQDQGQLIEEVDARSGFSRRLARLAHDIEQRIAAEAA